MELVMWDTEGDSKLEITDNDITINNIKNNTITYFDFDTYELEHLVSVLKIKLAYRIKVKQD